MDNVQITVRADTCVWVLDPVLFFEQSTLTKIREMIKYLFQDAESNAEAIKTFGEVLVQKTAEKKTALDDGGRMLRRRYIDPKRYVAARDKDAAIRNNKKLLLEVARRDRVYQKYQKSLTTFEKKKNRKNAKETTSCIKTSQPNH